MTTIHKIAILLLALQLLSGSLQAQAWVLSSDPGESVDSVTVGSRAGYKINYDPLIKSFPASIMDPSVFDWKFSGSQPVLPLNGTTTPLTAADAQGFYTDTAISMIAPDTIGLMYLTVHEKSRPLIGSGCADPLGQKLPIRVLPRPTLKLDSIMGGNSKATTFNIPMKVTGYGPWIVEYSIITNATTTSVTDTLGSVTDAVGNQPKDLLLTVKSPLNADLTGITVTFTNILDRVSNKSLDKTLVKSQAADLPESSYKYFVYPEPKTQKIIHQRNK